MTTDSHATGVSHSHLHSFIDGRLSVRDHLIDEVIVDMIGVGTYNRHRRVVEYRVAAQREEYLGVTADFREALS